MGVCPDSFCSGGCDEMQAPYERQAPWVEVRMLIIECRKEAERIRSGADFCQSHFPSRRTKTSGARRFSQFCGGTRRCFPAQVFGVHRVAIQSLEREIRFLATIWIHFVDRPCWNPLPLSYGAPIWADKMRGHSVSFCAPTWHGTLSSSSRKSQRTQRRLLTKPRALSSDPISQGARRQCRSAAELEADG